MKLDAWGNSVTGLVRSDNQDAFALRPEHGVFVLADGLGGHPEGERASRIAVGTICRRLVEQHDPEAAAAAWESRLLGALAEAQAALRAASREYLEAPPYLPMASTAVVLVVPPPGRQVYWTHCGDSRLYRLRATNLELLTADHTRFGDAYRHGASIAVDLEHTNHLNQALGTADAVSTCVGSSALLPGDLFLLCSDGVSGMLSAQVIATILAQSHSAQAAGEALIDAALRAGGHDNATVVVVGSERR